MQAKTKRSVRFIALGIAIAAGLIGALTQLRGGHGLIATYFPNPDDAVPHLTRVEEIALVSSNDNVINPTDLFRIEWDGYIWINRFRDYEFFSPKDISGQLVIDGRFVFDYLVGPVNSDGYLFQLDNGLHEIKYISVKSDSAREYFFAALDWNTPLGRRHVPANMLYSAVLDVDDAMSAQRRACAHSIALIALFACILVIGATYTSLPDHWWHRRTFWLLLGIVLLAFTL